MASLPDIPGRDAFARETYHTGQWPHEGVDVTGKRVGIIGTGATAIQAIPLIAEQAEHLTVFQRTPNYAIPSRNGPVDPEQEAERRAYYEGLRERTRNSFAGFELWAIDRSALEDSPEEREREYQARWDTGGFGLWLGNYSGTDGGGGPSAAERRPRLGGRRRRGGCGRRSAG